MNMTVISAPKSSTVTMPYGFPDCRAVLCCTLVMSPAMVTMLSIPHRVAAEHLRDRCGRVLGQGRLKPGERMV